MQTYVSEQLGKPLKDVEYSDIKNLVDDLERDMPVAIKEILKANQWKEQIRDFFVAPQGVTSLDNRWVSKVYQYIRQDPSKPYWKADNVIPLTIDNFKKVIEKLREVDGSLKNYGLMKGIVPGLKEEVYVLPFIKRMIDMRRTINMRKNIQDFIDESPDLFVSVNRSLEGTLGLESTEAIANNLVDQLRTSLKNIQDEGLKKSFPIKETQQGTVTKSGAAYKKYDKAIKEQDKTYDPNFYLDQTFEPLFHQIRTVLFDGMAKDIWANSARDVQKKFINKYLDKMIETKTPFVRDMDAFVSEMYTGPEAVLRSNTFNQVEKKVNEIFAKIDRKFKNVPLSPEQRELYEKLQSNFASIVESMRSEYLNVITGRTDGVTDSLFTLPLQNMTDYMLRFGVDDGTLLDSIKSQKPRFEYIGQRNLGYIYGDTNQKSLKQILEIVDNKNTKQFFSELQKKFAVQMKPSENILPFFKSFWGDAFNLSRRWNITRMLGGYVEPAIKFFGINRWTAPILYLAALGSSKMRAGEVGGFIGRSLSFGVGPAAEAVARKFGYKSITTKSKSNRVLYAPADEVIITQEEGALRNMTAGELREVMLRENIEYSRADTDFYETQFNKLLVDSGLTAAGAARYGKTVLGLPTKWIDIMSDYLQPGKKNIWQELGRAQDTEMRRYVFFESLKNGETFKQAASKARVSMLDYGSLTDVEKIFISKWFYFYAFTRAMGAEVVNTFYRGVVDDSLNPMIGMMKALSKINRDTEERTMNNQTRSRLYNIYTKSAEGSYYYAGGPVNPASSMFELLSTGWLNTGASLKSTVYERERDMSLLNRVFNVSGTLFEKTGKTLAEGNPLTKLWLESQQKVPIPFPSYLVFQAEENGNMLELINLYNLVPRSPSPGRPLTRFPIRDKTTGEILYPAGTYFDFQRKPNRELTEQGKKDYNLYIFHRLVGYTAFAEIASRSGMAPAALTRMNKDMLQAEMFTRKGPQVTTRTGVETIPTEEVYLKSANQQTLDMNTDLLYMLYISGLLTPVKVSKREVILERLLNDTLSEIKSLEQNFKTEK